jgi:UDP-4-amino-4,6-dideoxy-L-N-acetyl-beta-L-altrosamine transaminase
VITSPFTFASVVSAISLSGGIPVFVDVEQTTGGIAVDCLTDSLLRRSKAIVLSNYAGIPFNPSIVEIAHHHGLFVIDDSAHSIGATRKNNQPIQSEADATCLSFNSTKIVTCGEGGAILTNNGDLAKKLRLLRNYGMTKTSFEKTTEGPSFDVRALSLNFKFNDIQASILLPQIEIKNINNLLLRRRKIAEQYNQLCNSSYFYLLKPDNQDRPSWLWQPIILARELAKFKKQIISYMKIEGIEVGLHYPVISDLSFLDGVDFEDNGHDNAKDLARRVLTLPCHEGMELKDVNFIVETLLESIRNILKE